MIEPLTGVVKERWLGAVETELAVIAHMSTAIVAPSENLPSRRWTDRGFSVLC